jgi:hypothetical protein
MMMMSSALGCDSVDPGAGLGCRITLRLDAAPAPFVQGASELSSATLLPDTPKVADLRLGRAADL